MIKSLRTISLPSSLRVAFRYLFISGVVLFLSGIVTSCTKKPSQLGGGILPDSALNAYYTDTLSVRTYSSVFDSATSNEKGFYIIGNLKDPIFGTTASSFYTQLGQSVTHSRYGTDPQLDSLVLQLSYATVFGDSTSELRMHVYELDQEIYGDSTYYSNQIPKYYPTDYADFTFNPSTSNYALQGSDTIRGVVRINLSDISKDLGNKLLHADTTVLDSNYLFVKYFKGLYITSDLVSGDGAIVSFNPATTSTVMFLYYHNQDQDSLSATYLYGTGMAYANHYKHDFSQANADFVKQIVQKDTLLGQTKYYVQGLAGVKTIIKFPDLIKLAREGKIGINEAKLVLPGNEPQPYFKAPTQLSLLKIASDTSFSSLADQNEGATYFGGTYKASTNSYEFHITHYIQSLVSDTTQSDRGLLLYINGGTVYPERFVFNGMTPENDTLNRTKLELIYTKLN